MFTGIIEDIGQIKNIVRKTKEIEYTIGVNNIDASEIELGESISVNGICLTVITMDSNSFTIEASEETQSKTSLASLGLGSDVNLERALKVGGRFGGHIVSGHIDGVGKIESISNIGDSIEVWVVLPDNLSKYVVEKGSVAIDGVSLTVNLVKNNKFSVNIIPYTQKETIFSEYSIGSIVNIECDIVGKYVEKLLGDKDTKNSENIGSLIRKL